MDNKFIWGLIGGLVILTGISTSLAKPQTENPAATAAQSATKSTTAAASQAAPSAEASKAAATAVKQPFVVANRDLTNLQLTDPTVPVYDLLSVQERRQQGLPTALPSITPYKQGKIAYLTFDDGPDNKNTPAVLDILKQQNVKGTFYVVGSFCYSHPDVLLRMFKEGHAIGNHSYTHDYDKLYPNVNNFLNEMFSTEKVLRELLGYRSFIIRAPGGKPGMFTSAYPPALKEAGLVEHDWNVSVQDAVTNRPPAQEFINRVSEQTADGKRSAIILMHCSYGKEETVKALPGIIQLLRDRGYSFGVVTPMTPQPW